MRTSPAIFALVAAALPHLAPAQVVLHDGFNNFDVNNDGIADFTLNMLYDCPSGGFLRATVPGPGGSVSHAVGPTNYADSLPAGSIVGPSQNFTPTSTLMICGPSGASGEWINSSQAKYIGLRLVLSGQTHYAWALIRLHSLGRFVLISFYCQQEPDVPIQVGDNGTGCADSDFNNDGDIGTDADIDDFFRCLAGDCCLLCDTADFNHDGDIGTDADIENFFFVLAGGC